MYFQFVLNHPCADVVYIHYDVSFVHEYCYTDFCKVGFKYVIKLIKYFNKNTFYPIDIYEYYDYEEKTYKQIVTI